MEEAEATSKRRSGITNDSESEPAQPIFLQQRQETERRGRSARKMSKE